jgi:hypothetical protein
MALWLILIAACCLIWAGIWKSNLILALGVLVGVLLAWLLSYLIEPYLVTRSMENVPVWLPPLPMATVAVTLLVYGAIIWIRGNDALPKPKPKDTEHHH